MSRPIGVLFLLIGLGASLGAVWLTVSTIRFKVTAEKTVGTVVKFEYRTSSRSRSGRTQKTWSPTFEFVDASGATQRVTSSYSSSSTSRKIGDKVPVRYAPDEPQRARIDSFASYWPGTLICLCLGATFSAFGLAIVWKPRGR